MIFALKAPKEIQSNESDFVRVAGSALGVARCIQSTVVVAATDHEPA